MAKRYTMICEKRGKTMFCHPPSRKTKSSRRRRAASKISRSVKSIGSKIGNTLQYGWLPKGMKPSKKQKTLIGLGVLGLGAWAVASYFKVIPEQVNLFSIINASPLGPYARFLLPTGGAIF